MAEEILRSGRLFLGRDCADGGAATNYQQMGPLSSIAGPRDDGGVVARFLSNGARIVGGCCGSTPQHIGAIAEAIIVAGWKLGREPTLRAGLRMLEWLLAGSQAWEAGE